MMDVSEMSESSGARRREDLSPLAERLLEFLQDRLGVAYPLAEVARYLQEPEKALLHACQELYTARAAVMVSASNSDFSGFVEDLAEVVDASYATATHVALCWEGHRATVNTRVVAAHQDVSEHDVLDALAAYVAKEPEQFDVWVEAVYEG